jgi:hydrogenase/urease accessory protein HupE
VRPRRYYPAVPKAALVALGIVLLLLVTFAHPFEGNTYGFCPIFKSPLHAANDVVVAAIDITAAWLIYRGLRRSHITPVSNPLRMATGKSESNK